MTRRWLRILAATALVFAAMGAQAATAETADGSDAVAAVTAGSSQPSDLTGVDVLAGAEGRTAVVLDLSGPAEYDSFVLQNPDRLVVDLRGVVSRLDAHSFRVGEAGVVRVRAGQYRLDPDPVSRVVFDLERPVAYDVVLDGRTLTVSFGEAPVAETAAPGPVEAAPVVAEAVEPAPAPAVEPEPEPASSPEPVEVAAPAPVPAAETDDAPATRLVKFTPAEPAAAVAEAPAAKPEPAPVPAPKTSRAVTPESIDRLLRGAPELAAPQEGTDAAPRANSPAGFETKRILTDQTVYTGKRISFNLVDADIKQLFRLFHDVSGLNFVLDPSVSGKVTIVLDNVPWDQALDIILKNNGLDKVLENNVIRIAPTQKLAAEAAQRKQLKEAKELEVEPITITRTLSYAKSVDVEKVIRDGGILSPRGKVIVDQRTNTLIISDIPKKVEPIDALISTLDTETPQVMIEARIVETTRSFVQDLGVDWGFSAVADASRGTSTGIAFPNNASVKYGLNLPGDGGASNLAFKFGNIVDSFTLDVALNALETEGRGRILSSPKIATQNNERAEIEQGLRIPVVNTTATEINVEFVSASLRMEVTPQITAEGTIILDLTVENNSPDFNNTVGDVPPINTQRAQTKVLIADGGTTVIGGIFTVNEGRSEAGVPWFRKLPGLGWLFRTTKITSENRELLIFITPRIMKIG